MSFYLDEVEFYLQNKLKVRLQKYGVSCQFTGQIIDNVKMQIYSFIKLWNDITIRKGLLTIGMEEGLFYLPKAKKDVQCFIVVAIRNSLIETIQSEDFSRTGLQKTISGNPMQEITQEAIIYFNKLDFCNLSKKMNVTDEFNYYQNVLVKCPIAWEALHQIGLSNTKKIIYTSVVASTPLKIESFNSTCEHNVNSLNKKVVIEDGMSEELDDTLLQILRQIANGDLKIFYADSLKFLTRNFKKLMTVMDFMLSNDCAFVTNNYYIENGYIEIRTSLIPASHNVAESTKKLHNTAGLGRKHKFAIKQLMNHVNIK